MDARWCHGTGNKNCSPHLGLSTREEPGQTSSLARQLGREELQYLHSAAPSSQHTRDFEPMQLGRTSLIHEKKGKTAFQIVFVL